MIKFKNNLLSRSIIFVSFAFLNACSFKGIVAFADGDISLWTTHSNTLVLRDNSSYNAKTAIKPVVLSKDVDVNLSISMGKAETEGAQLIITPKKKISSFDCQWSDLTFGDKIISKEKISVYQQFYAFVKEDENSYINFNYLPSGYYPDFLVPFEWAKAYHENYIVANQNQGLTIEVDTDVTTAPGTYTGNFRLTLDGNDFNIPMSVKVYDVDLSKSYLRGYAASSAYITYDQYDWLLNKYRLHGQFPAMGTVSPEHALESLNHYWDNPHFCNFEIPNSSPDLFRTYLRYLARHSTLSRNYLSKCSIYIQSQDEPNGVNGPEDSSAVCAQYKAVKEQVKNELSNYLGNQTLINAVKKAIDDIPLMITVNLYRHEHTAARFNTETNDLTFCLSQSVGRYNEIYTEFFNESKQQMWQYHNNAYPFVGHQLPSLGVGLRSHAWGCMAYNYAGYLFWDFDETRSATGLSYAEAYRARDYFNDIYSFNNSAGDGCIVVPASKFGHPEAFIASSRLRSSRDGTEDHSLLTTLKQYYENNLLSEYEIRSAFNFNESFDWIFSRGISHSGAYLEGTDETLFEMREIVFQLLELAKSPYRVVNGGITYHANQATMTLYANASQITVDGNNVNGQHIKDNSYKYVINFDMESRNSIYSTIGFGSGDSKIEWTFKVFFYGKLINAFNNIDNANLSNYVVSSSKGKNVPAGSVTYQNNKLTFTISPAGSSDSDNVGYSPEFKFKSALFGVNDIFDVGHLTFDIKVKYNGEKDYMNIIAYDNVIDSFTGDYDTDFRIENTEIDENGYYTMTISYNVGRVAQNKISSISYILSSFHGDKVNKYHNGAIVEISNLYFSNYAQGGNE